MSDEDAPPDAVEILFEGDADDRPLLEWPDGSEDEPPPPTHVVGNDRLAALVTAVGDSVADLRDQRRSEAMTGTAAGGRGAPLFAEQEPQVVQATQTPLDLVLALLADGVADRAARRRLRLGHTTQPQLEYGMAAFAGRLRLRPRPLHRRVTLRVYPTASHNLTVLELVPDRHLPWLSRTDAFLAAGVPAITELSDAIETAAASVRPPGRSG